jgi:GH15 family glucan-1,4-alpha-glucosidase
MSIRGEIKDLALLGDTRTAALVDLRGSIEWLCLPRFDGEPVFARLVHDDGGSFGIRPLGDATVVARRYQPGTAVVETEWDTGAGRVLVTEGMIAEVEGTGLPTFCLVRRVEALGGAARVALEFDPRFGPSRRQPRRRAGGHGLVCTDGRLALWLGADRPLPDLGDGPVEVDVEAGRPLTLVLTAADRGPLTFVPPEMAWRSLVADARAWQRWSDGCDYAEARSEAVVRSLITLRLLTYSPSGAPVAAPTSSLPEELGGSRNWDYRYAWPRDASIGIGAFLGVGLAEQAHMFLYWLLHASRLDRPRLPALLTVHGTPPSAERELDWSGYAGSRPVRLGNDARGQHQLDNYGWVLDAMWLIVRAGDGIFREAWRAGAALADEVARRWREPDAGLWEARADPAHYVHSKAMAWLALDRSLRIADVHPVSARRRERWQRERDAIASDVVRRGFDADRNTFVRAYGRTDADAALLLLPIIGIEPVNSPRVRGTIDFIRRELTAGGPLLYRYPPGSDGVPGKEGAFLPCSFWLVQALAVTGAVDEARALFDELLALGGPLGLFAEEVDPSTGSFLGNHPQAFSHATLVQAALALRDAEHASAPASAGALRQPGSSSKPNATP